jgi:hypothetical protein
VVVLGIAKFFQTILNQIELLVEYPRRSRLTSEVNTDELFIDLLYLNLDLGLLDDYRGLVFLNFIFNPICKPFCLKIDPKELI